MREILFRGKRWDNGMWAESQYQVGTLFAGCVNADFDMETVGQYTGLTDKNGVKIFEGDIVKAVLHGGNYDLFEFPLGVVIFEHGAFSLKDRRDTTPICSFAPAVSFEVIGNIYDNQELLGGTE